MVLYILYLVSFCFWHSIWDLASSSSEICEMDNPRALHCSLAVLPDTSKECKPGIWWFTLTYLGSCDGDRRNSGATLPRPSTLGSSGWAVDHLTITVFTLDRWNWNWRWIALLTYLRGWVVSHSLGIFAWSVLYCAIRSISPVRLESQWRATGQQVTSFRWNCCNLWHFVTLCWIVAGFSVLPVNSW